MTTLLVIALLVSLCAGYWQSVELRFERARREHLQMDNRGLIEQNAQLRRERPS